MADSKKQLYSFIPRSLSRNKQPKRSNNNNNNNNTAQHKSQLVSIQTTDTDATSTATDASTSTATDATSTATSTSAVSPQQTQEDEVKAFSVQQRWPGPEEPSCIVCERYGEYICDETEEDVCSLECKTKHLTQQQQQQEEVSEAPHSPQNEVSTRAKNEVSNLPPKEITFTLDVNLEDFHSYYSTNCVHHFDVATPNERSSALIRETLDIRTKGRHIPRVIENFKQCSFPDVLYSNLKENGFLLPTPVQMQVIPAVLQHRDVLVSAPTSSGKSASFLLPIIHNIHKCLGEFSFSSEYCKFPVALVVVPTRELALQVEETAKIFSKSLKNLKTALLIGGLPLPPQLHRLKRKVQLVIGTPGRINDILRHYNDLKFDYLKMIVLDEVDVMLQMGFHNQITSIVEQAVVKPQLAMFSATIPTPIETMATKMMNDPMYISVGTPGQPNVNVKQFIIWVEEATKRKKLFSILRDPKHFSPPTLIFVNSKTGADLLVSAITEKFNLKCESVHSDKLQCDRTNILDNFLANVYDILVCTNVMGRGVNFAHVRQVILFDLPTSLEEYVHQVGRAGGLVTRGSVLAFVNNTDKKLFFDLKEFGFQNDIRVPDEVLHSPLVSNEVVLKRRKRKVGGKVARWNEDVTPQSLLEILTKNSRKRKI